MYPPYLGTGTLKWLELSISAPSEYVEPLSHIFYRYGHGGTVIEQEGGFNPDEGELPPVSYNATLKTYLPIDHTTTDLRNRIDIAVRLVAHFSPITELHERVLEESEWANSWKKHFKVLHIGRSLVICPSWLTYKADTSKIMIQLDPGMAFGTGHHPTTKMCLQLLETNVNPSSTVLELGAGSGILSIAAAKLGASRVNAIEIESMAVKACKENVAANKVDSIVNVFHGSLPHEEIGPDTYDLVVSNISAKTIIEKSALLADYIVSGGTLIASGIVKEHRLDVEQALIAHHLSLITVTEDGDWIALLAFKKPG